MSWNSTSLVRWCSLLHVLRSSVWAVERDSLKGGQEGQCVSLLSPIPGPGKAGKCLIKVPLCRPPELAPAWLGWSSYTNTSPCETPPTIFSLSYVEPGLEHCAWSEVLLALAPSCPGTDALFISGREASTFYPRKEWSWIPVLVRPCSAVEGKVLRHVPETFICIDVREKNRAFVSVRSSLTHAWRIS
jgi:hypothetical protein